MSETWTRTCVQCSARHMRQAYGAIAAGRSAHDIATQVAMIRETDKTAGHVVVSYSPVSITSSRVVMKEEDRIKTMELQNTTQRF